MHVVGRSTAVENINIFADLQINLEKAKEVHNNEKEMDDVKDDVKDVLEIKMIENHQKFQDEPTFLASLLKACAKQKDLQRGSRLHAAIVETGLAKKHVFIGNALINMYAKCCALAKAQEIFNQLPVRDIVSWNSLIAGYTQQGHDEAALYCFQRMQHEGFTPNAVTFCCILKACAGLGASDNGQELHAEISRNGLLEENVIIGSTLVNMYAKFGELDKAQEVFDKLSVRNIVAWNALIAGYAQHGHNEEALDCFERMEGEGLSPDAVTFVCLLRACGSIRAVDKGEKIRAQIMRGHLLDSNILLGNALVDMYAKFGLMGKALEVFNELPAPDIVSWTTLISGYAQNLHGEEAILCFEQMRFEGFSPDDVAYVCLLKACGSIGALCEGQEIFCEIIRGSLLENNVVVGNASIDFYANSGMLAEAQEVFEEMPMRNVVSWNTLMGGYAQFGKNEKVFGMFKKMLGEGIEPDVVTFTKLMTMCSHEGLLVEGEFCFEHMSSSYGDNPNFEHHTCMIDLFCRAGHLEMVVVMIKDMLFQANLTLWYTVLGACRDWGNMKLAGLAFEQIAQDDEKDAAVYVCMSNMYAAPGWQ